MNKCIAGLSLKLRYACLRYACNGELWCAKIKIKIKKKGINRVLHTCIMYFVKVLCCADCSGKRKRGEEKEEARTSQGNQFNLDRRSGAEVMP